MRSKADKVNSQPIIFDMDGVIIDSEPHFRDHIQAFLVKIGVDEPDISDLNFKGVSSSKNWTLLIERFNLNYDLQEIIDHSRKSYLDYLNSLEDMPEIPGVSGLIKHLYSSGYKLALASSAGPQRIDLFLNKLKLKQYFSIIVSGDDVKNSKPAPDIFLLAAKKLGVKPAECVVIEDAENGVGAAKAAGMKCIAYGGSDHNLDDLSKADTVITDFRALTNSLKNGTLPV